MKTLITLGVIMLLAMSIISGAYAAQNNEKWGYKMNINLKDQLQPYLKVATDELVNKLNGGNGTYHINSYDSSINGEFKMAGAMMKTANGIKYESGEYTNANLSFYANGTFPYASNVSQLLKGEIKQSNLNISTQLTVISTHISNGTVEESSPNNISKITTTSYTYLKIHVKGKNLPIPAVLYYILNTRATKSTMILIGITLKYQEDMSAPDKMCLKANVTEKIGIHSTNSLIKISQIFSNNKNITLSVKDTNKDGYFDSGDYICIQANSTYLNNLMNSFEPIKLKANITYGSSHISLTIPIVYTPMSKWIGGTVGTYYLRSVNSEFEALLNETKNFPVYDNFDFTIKIKLYEKTTTSYIPSLPLIPRNSENITINTTGNYSGTIEINGLQEKYMRVLETLLNTTFPVNIAEWNTPIPGIGNGTINESTTIEVNSANITGTMQYGGEKVYIVNLNIPKKNSEFSLGLAYFYSPTKKFIVGGSIHIGPKKFDTQATSYDDAVKEINTIKNVESNGGTIQSTPSSLSTWEMAIIVVIIVVVVAVVATVFIRKK